MLSLELIKIRLLSSNTSSSRFFLLQMYISTPGIGYCFSVNIQINYENVLFRFEIMRKHGFRPISEHDWMHNNRFSNMVIIAVC